MSVWLITKSYHTARESFVKIFKSYSVWTRRRQLTALNTIRWLCNICFKHIVVFTQTRHMYKYNVNMSKSFFYVGTSNLWCAMWRSTYSLSYALISSNIMRTVMLQYCRLSTICYLCHVNREANVISVTLINATATFAFPIPMDGF